MKHIIKLVKKRIRDSKLSRDLKKSMLKDAKMDIIKASLEAEKKEQIKLVQDKAKLKAKKQLEHYENKLNKKNPKNKNCVLIVILLLILLVLILIL